MMSSSFRGSLLVAGTLALVAAGPRLLAQPVGAEFRANSYITGYQSYTSVAMDPGSGRFVVVWGSENQDGSSYGIFGQRFDSSGNLEGGEFRINTTTTGLQRASAVAHDGVYNFVVVWESETAPRAILGQRYSIFGPPIGGEFRISSYTTGFASGQLDVATDIAGNFVVVWRDEAADSSGGGILARRFDNAGAPLGPEFRVNTTTTHPQWKPAVAADAVGNFVVVWTNVQDNGWDVFGQRYASTGAPLGTEFQISSSPTGTQDDVDVATGYDGGFLTVFDSVDTVDTYGSVRARAWSSAGAPLGADFQVKSYTTTGASNPQVAWATPGIYIVTWEGGLPVDEIKARRVTPAGATLGPEFIVNTFTLFSQDEPAIAASVTGNFVVTWTSYIQDFHKSAAMGQRFVSYPLPTGDANADGSVTVADIFYLINYLFAAGPAPVGKADVNASGTTDVADVFYLISHLFAGGPPPQ